MISFLLQLSYIRHFIRKEVNHLTEKQILEQLLIKVTNIESNVEVLKTDVANLKKDMKEVKEDVITLKTEQQLIKQAVLETGSDTVLMKQTSERLENAQIKQLYIIELLSSRSIEHEADLKQVKSELTHSSSTQ